MPTRRYNRVRCASPAARPHVMSNGFTLIELLVVIGIIAVLVGILMPTLSRARESANSTACLANLRTWGQGMFMYMSEFGRFPSDGFNTAGLPEIISDRSRKVVWINVIPPKLSYMSYAEMCDKGQTVFDGDPKSRLFVCPSNGIQAGDGDGVGGVVPYTVHDGAKLYIDYIYCAKFTGANNSPPRPGQLRRSSDTVLLFERRANTSPRELPLPKTVASQTPAGLQLAYDDTVRAAYAAKPLNIYRGQWDHISGRHRNGSNMVYCDGSARWIPFGHTQLVIPGSSPLNHNTPVLTWAPLRDVAN